MNVPADIQEGDVIKINARPYVVTGVAEAVIYVADSGDYYGQRRRHLAVERTTGQITARSED